MTWGQKQCLFFLRTRIQYYYHTLFYLLTLIPILQAEECKNNPDLFCCICDEVKTMNNQKPINGFVRKTYHAYLEVKLGDQKKSWAPHIVFKHVRITYASGLASGLAFLFCFISNGPNHFHRMCFPVRFVAFIYA